MKLSKAQFRVVVLLAMGFQAKEIGAKLFNSTRTITTHLERVRENNNLRNSYDVVREFVLAHGDPKQYVKTLCLAIMVVFSFSIKTVRNKRFNKRNKSRNNIARVITTRGYKEATYSLV